MHQARQGLAVQLPLLMLVVLVVLNLTLSVVAQEPCTSADYEAQYSQCRPSYTHDLIWYKTRNSTCVGGESVPAAVFDLPCNTTCGMGQYLPLGGLSCAACTPGTYSLGGGRTVDDWSTWPTELGIFSTSCLNKNIPSNCSGWTLTGTTVRSGAITHVQSSVLLLQTQLLIAGYVRFSFRVDAEPVWDGLIFYVDGTIILPKISVTSFYRDFTANLTAGFHTLKWEYFKDVSDSRGEDAAFIRSIQISGLSYAESACTECPEGSAASGTGSTQCSACPLNTVASEEGSSACQPCPDGQYSYVGASSCIPKIACTEKDYQMLYGPCSGGTRVVKASWLEPHICDDTGFQLPERNEGCAACPPGTQQDASLNCVPCASGFYSAGNGAPCQECVAGSAAARVLNISTFDSWTTNMSTSCTGDCGSNGWRLRSGFIDSGAGHGNEVDSVLALDVVLEQPGSVTFTFVLNCSRFCALYYLDFPYDASVSWNTTTSRNKVITHTRPIEAGVHRLTWTFEEDAYDPTPNNRTDAVKIYGISVTGTTTGGATACQTCKDGSIAGASASFCTNCTSGYSSDPSRTQCTQCPGNTFSRDEGLLCSECGPTTTANSNHSDCTDTCSFSLGGLNYSLSPLSGKAFGPVKYDIYSYYFNLCGRGNFIPDCHDVDDNPLITKVCQILPYGYALDVGWSSGYHPLASGARGFRVHYDLGDMGCGPRNNGVAYPRNSDINFICDLSAGTGSVASNGPVEDRPCHYNFEWRSIYACPVCSEADYSFYYTNCDSSGRRTKVYYWKDPILCRDGVTLPLAEQVPCSDSTQICPVGQRLGDDSKSCTSCAVGEYSVGGGVLYSRNWPVGDLPDGFASPCISAGCTSWSSEDGLSIHSGFGNSSLVGSFAFRTQGSISFKYKVYLESDGYFSFSIDGQTLIRSSGQSRYDWVLFTQNLRPGSHVFQWNFADGKRFSPALGGYQAVVVSDLYIQGLDFHADSCLPCPDGTYSTNSSSVLGCTPCPAGNYSSIQSNVCAACPAGQYSIAGSSNCIAKTPCTIASYVPIYTECFSGKRNVSYTKALPDTCSGGIGLPPARVGIACATCPLYTLPQGDICVPCPAGQVLTDGVCVANVAGNIIHRTQVYFGDNSLSKWPSNFFTGCTGSCGSNGWRILDGAIDSGFHSTNTIDSFVGLVTDFEYHGSVSFVVSQSTVNPGTLNGLTFTVDDRYIQIPVALNQTQNMTVNVDIIQGHRVLKWNFHQEGTSGGARISNIVLSGVEGGAAGEALPCPAGSFSGDVAATTCNVCSPGTYTKDAGSSSCISCPVNTYNPNYGATECMPCEFGSYANVNGSVLCSTTCQFTLDTGDSFDLTTLPGPITVYDDFRKKYLINVCNTLERCPNSHSCIINVDDTTLEAGNSIKVVPDSSNSTATPFSIRFEHGELCHASSNERATVIEFQCDAESPSNFPAFIDEDDDCVATFTWRTLAACRKCTDADYTVVRGACSGGRRTMSKTRVKSCNGEAYVALEEEKCSGREVNLAVILVVVFVLVAVVAVAAFIFFRNRRLSARYNALVEESRSSNVTL